MGPFEERVITNERLFTEAFFDMKNDEKNYDLRKGDGVVYKIDQRYSLTTTKCLYILKRWLPGEREMETVSRVSKTKFNAFSYLLGRYINLREGI